MIKGRCWCPFFCKSISKSSWGRKPNEKQGPKAHQEDQWAREVQKNKCKGKQSIAKCKSTVDYRSAAEYRSTA